MRRLPSLFASSALVLTASVASAAPADTAGQRWVLTEDLYGTPIYGSLILKRDGDALTGTIDGDALKGTAKGQELHFSTAEPDGSGVLVEARISGDRIEGTVVSTDGADKAHPQHYRFTGEPAPARAVGAPVHHEFVPTVFHRTFTAANAPVLTISPGDTVHTTTVDAGGTDEKGAKRVLGGNPQTGPFYVRTALPGDTLAIHIRRLKLNRDYAVSDDYVVERAMTANLAVKMKDAGKTVRWHLDIEKGLASLETPGEHTRGFSVPVKPMLGCVATAPSPSRGGFPTGDSGAFGGNMDFNEIVEGATVYLPVNVPGALLYLGDAHAVQGDGELAGNALETSMDVEFSVEVIPDKRPGAPRVESATEIMAMGLGGSVDEALKLATSNMSGWLTERYHLTPSEVASVLGVASRYRISEVADRNAGVVLKLDKSLLTGLSPDGEAGKP